MISVSRSMVTVASVEERGRHEHGPALGVHHAHVRGIEGRVGDQPGHRDAHRRGPRRGRRPARAPRAPPASAWPTRGAICLATRAMRSCSSGSVRRCGSRPPRARGLGHLGLFRDVAAPRAAAAAPRRPALLRAREVVREPVLEPGDVAPRRAAPPACRRRPSAPSSMPPARSMAGPGPSVAIASPSTASRSAGLERARGAAGPPRPPSPRPRRRLRPELRRLGHRGEALRCRRRTGRRRRGSPRAGRRRRSPAPTTSPPCAPVRAARAVLSRCVVGVRHPGLGRRRRPRSGSARAPGRAAAWRAARSPAPPRGRTRAASSSCRGRAIAAAATLRS